MVRAWLVGVAVLGLSTVGLANDPLVVHEWGTFTALQDEQGRALGRINTDDEPVPGFVHEMAGAGMFPPTAAFTSEGKGVPAGDPNVTMRLETPVLYFHAPRGETGPVKVDVDVGFRGGWLTQYFPEAKAEVEGTKAGELLPALASGTMGRLVWKGLVVNGEGGTMPESTEGVWRAPRAVDSAMVTTGREREKFLFYRGVGHVEAPVRVLRHGGELEIQCTGDDCKVGMLWLVDVRGDGTVAFRQLAEMGKRGVILTKAGFEEWEYGRGNLTGLRGELHKTLVGEGLFADEAEGLLNTWERSYFRNPGERVFFMVPREWTERVLPLRLSVAANVTRVMVGRVELVTPAQRELLKRMARATPAQEKGLKDVAAAMNALRKDAARAETYSALAGGHGRLEDLGVAVPGVYADYLALGRFRTALLLSSPEGSLLELAGVLTP